MKSEDEIEKTAIKVSNVSIFGNAVLFIFKLFAGIFANSSAMVSDAIHSASDVFSSIVVIIGVKLSSKASDESHPYGHERLECVAAIILSVVLFITGAFIGYNAVIDLIYGTYKKALTPGVLALIAAAVSIIAKEGMYQYTMHFAKKLDLSSLKADAWHHRSDAFSSIGALVGIFGARLGFLWCDAVASIIICLLVVKASFDIFMEAVKKMVDHACSKELEQEIIDCAKMQKGVLGVTEIFSREFGSRIYIEITILADGDLTLRESNVICEDVHNAIELKFTKVKHISVTAIPCNY